MGEGEVGEAKGLRPKVYDPSLAPSPNPGLAVILDVNRLDLLRTESRTERSVATKRGKNKKAKACTGTNKKVNVYRTWRKEQKALKTGETNQQLRQRYLQLFPDRK
mmetsp:Transcript_5585/g.12251  ORF Transcript_5585/g.12251 Transcript_5585/m.12251 type:complete len:106 (+) Transcript_5585:511-828(+)